MSKDFDINNLTPSDLANATEEEVSQLLKIVEEARRQKFEVVKPRQIREIVPIQEWLLKEKNS